MPNPLNLRIRRWPFKLLYVVLAYGVTLAVDRLLALLTLGDIPIGCISLVLDTGAFLYGARVFRGSNEDIAAPRPRWRMTARRPLSKGLGVLFTVLASLELIGVVLAVLGLAGMSFGRLDSFGSSGVAPAFATAQCAILAFLYLRSVRGFPITPVFVGEPEFRIDRLYQLFNARLAGEAVRFLHPEVEWPNGWEGGYVHGRKAVREYWERQWKEIHPRVTPLSIHIEEDGRLTVRVHQVVHDREGKRLSDTELQHVYRARDELFDRMEIRENPARGDRPSP